MDLPQFLALLGALTALMVAMASLVHEMHQVHQLVNSRMDELLAVTKRAAHAEGVLDAPIALGQHEPPS